MQQQTKPRFYVSPAPVILAVVGALALVGLVVPKAPEPLPPPCTTDWTACTHNSDLLDNNRPARAEVTSACTSAANNSARYGSPVWPWGAFGRYRDGALTGTLTVFEDNVRFQNGFGAMARVTVACTYDLHHRRVTNLQVNP